MTNDTLNSRRAALRAFDAVYRRGQSLDSVSEEIFKDAGLERRDKLFVRLLVTDLLRHLGEIDAFLSQFIKHPIPSKEWFVQDVLRLSALQAVFLKTPAHAVVSTGVELLKPYKNGGFTAFANAVLRKAVNEESLPEGAYLKNFPNWLTTAWQQAYGAEKMRQTARAFLKEAPLDFSVKENPALWAERLDGKVLAGGTVRRSDSAVVTDLDGFETGAWWVQDFSASLPVKMFSDLKGKKVLDICAAPGGKTAQLCAAGANVTALDVSAGRVKRLKENMKRLGFAPKIVTADFRKWQLENAEKRFDAILLDAPCSATGTLRRHPDVMYHRTPADVGRLNQTQKELLDAALSLLSPNGELIYAVCSLLPQEGTALIDGFEKAGKISRLPVSKEELPAEVICKNGDALVFPDTFESDGGCDGFYACRMKKGEKYAAKK